MKHRLPIIGDAFFPVIHPSRTFRCPLFVSSVSTCFPVPRHKRAHYLTLSGLFTFCLTVSLLHVNVSSRAHRILVHHMSPDVQREGIPHWSVCERRKYHIHKQYKHSQRQVPKKRNKLMNRDSVEKLVPMD